MTTEEVFCESGDKYGDDFNWRMLSPSSHAFTAELKKEIGKNHFLHRKQIWAVAKRDSNDDILYLADNSRGADIYYIFHLTYFEYNTDGFPRYKKFGGINTVKECIEQSLSQGSSF